MLRGGERQGSRRFSARAVAGPQGETIQRQRTRGNVQPRPPDAIEFVHHRLSGLEPKPIDVRVLVNGGQTVPAVRRDHKHFGGVGVFRFRMPLGVAWGQPAFSRLNPDLQEMEWLSRSRVELAVCDAPARPYQFS